MEEITAAVSKLRFALDNDNDTLGKDATVEVILAFGTLVERFVIALEGIEINSRKN